jgi:hypothetical protein
MRPTAPVDESCALASNSAVRRATSLIAALPRHGWLLIAVPVALGVLVIALAAAKPAWTAWLALALAMPALAMAGFALLKARMLEFRPEVLGGDVILPRPGRIGERPKVLLPLQFTNAGYADGIIEWIALRLTLDGRTERSLLLSPVAEVDMQRFIQAKRKLEEENTIEPFTSFVLEGRRSAAKFVLFDLAERHRAAPLELQPGRYSFELFLKAGNSGQPKLERQFEHQLEQKQLEDYRNGTSVYLINYEVSLPSVRRALAASEWLPRATSN